MDYSVLGWVSGELDATLAQAVEALEEFADQGGDETRLQFCLTHLHQTHGIVRMLELQGAELLAGEAEAVAEALLARRVAARDSASETLMRGILRLRRYLERIQGGRDDAPGLLMPLINELRAARGEGALAPSALFAPDLGRVEQRPDAATRDGVDRRAATAPRARVLFQRGLLGVLRGESGDAGPTRMIEALESMDAASPDERRAAPWWVGAALVEAVRTGALQATDSEVRSLLTRLEREMKRVTDLGEEADAPPELVRAMLYHLAEIAPAGERVADVQRAYALASLREAQSALHGEPDEDEGPDIEALRAVAAVIREDVASIKDGLDLHVRAGARNPAGLDEAIEGMRRVAGTLGMLGLEPPRRTLLEHVEQLGHAADDGSAIMQAAEALLYVESELDRFAHGEPAGAAADEGSVFDGEYHAVHARVIDEAIREMGRIREAILRSLEGGDVGVDPEITRRFQTVRGALRVLNMPRVVGLLGHAARATERVMVPERRTDEASLDDLADAITSLEYYLEALRGGRREADRILDVAEDVLDRLAPPSGDAETALAEEEERPATPAPAGTSAPEPIGAPPPEGAGDVAHKRDRVDRDVPVRAESMDEEILEIFVEEVEEVLETLRESAPQWRADADDRDALLTTRRMFHTLKGSGRLAGALLLGELAWSVENLLNRILDGSREVSESVHEVVGEAVDLVSRLTEGVAEGSGGPVGAARALMMRAAAEADPEAVPESAPASERPEPSAMADAPSVSDGGDENDVREAGGASAPAAEQDAPEATEIELACEPTLDPTLYEIFRRETEDHLAEVARCLAAAGGSPEPCWPTEALVRALHTLAGSAHMADVEPVAELGRALENLVRARIADDARLDRADQGLLDRASAAIHALLDALGNAGSVLPETASLVAEINARGQSRTGPSLEELSDRARIAPADYAVARGETRGSAMPRAPENELDPELVGVFIEEARDILGFLEGTLRWWEESADPEAQVAELHRSLHTIKGGARLAGFYGIGRFSHALEALIAETAAGRTAADDRFFDLVRSSLDELADLVERAAQREQPEPDSELMARLQLEGGDETAAADADNADDRELRGVFLEESADILAESERLVQDWREQPQATEPPVTLQRALHTLKGGARMTGFTAVANLAHAIESLIREVGAGADESLFALLEACNDRLIQQRESVAAEGTPAPADDLLAAIASYTAAAAGSTEAAEPAASAAPATSEQPADTATPMTAPGVAMRGDVVRVSADALDSLVNHAGEVSIYRARLEQQAGTVEFNLTEFDQTVTRLREQLRTLEIETEAQILHGFGRDEADARSGQEEFDPLELDRFSRMQELSRALSESVNDLASLQGTLVTLNRENETLLLQQSRVNADLQDGLMRTRMVPFANLVPRMRRVLRQAARELGRQAKLEAVGAEGEMDRTVLERIVPPLEHMLRNAVAHGLEAPEARRGAGKPAAGTIRIHVSREGADVVVRLSDDGAGMDLAAIRNRAIDRGLMEPDAVLSEREIMQFVLEPGFSTASQVTEIAGRGIGMDVVNAEIKQLGGSLEIDSTHGEGTHFTVRLPFTLALNQALLCQAGDEAYAIPLSSIEGVVRAEPGFLQRALRSRERAYYEYAGEYYELLSLATLLGTDEVHVTDERALAPLILVQAGEHRVALQVDGLLGSRDIVVKSLGPQISSIPGIFGATILADGRVVLILDVGALLRYRGRRPEVGDADDTGHAVRAQPLVMVVDDSITMRKVATRLLERNGMDVVTAKDGVDAVTRLQDDRPDAVLLDIEMPRMDGYEFAAHMRNEPALCEVPIVMITSRTGEKHRQRAMEIGVDRYLGKPYQESELLQALQELLEAGRIPV